MEGLVVAWLASAGVRHSQVAEQEKYQPVQVAVALSACMKAPEEKEGRFAQGRLLEGDETGCGCR